MAMPPGQLNGAIERRLARMDRSCEADAWRLALETLLDGIHKAWAESQVVPDRCHRIVGSLVRPRLH